MCMSLLATFAVLKSPDRPEDDLDSAYRDEIAMFDRSCTAIMPLSILERTKGDYLCEPG